MRKGKALVKTLACLFLLPLSASFVQAQPAPVPKTGQTKCYNSSGVFVGCVKGSASRDDGYYRKGVAWPNPRFTDNGFGTVTDNLTGLMWTKDANLFGALPWSNAINACESLELGKNGCNIYSDWRLPSLFELESLRHLGYSSPALPNTAGTGQWSEGDPFLDVQSEAYYWSSTSYPVDIFYARGLSLAMGLDTFSEPKGADHHVWCVRGGQ